MPAFPNNKRGLIYKLDNDKILWLKGSLFLTQITDIKQYEKNVSTQQSQKSTHTWFQGQNEHQRWY
jgi:hypothetical protein